jgi:hypothetical protein
MLQGSETAIDRHMRRVHDSRQGNKSRDASWRVDMGNPRSEVIDAIALPICMS